MCVHKLKSKVVFFNQIKVLKNKFKEFLAFGFFLLKFKAIWLISQIDFETMVWREC